MFVCLLVFNQLVQLKCFIEQQVFDDTRKLGDVAWRGLSILTVPDFDTVTRHLKMITISKNKNLQ